MRQRSRFSDAVWTAFTETLRFIVVPLVLLNLVTSTYPLLTTPFMDNIVEYVTFYGGMVVAASTLEAMNRPGTYKRLLFGISALVFVCMWMFVMFGGGIAEFTYADYHFRFDITAILYIMLLGVSLKGLLVVDTFSSNRHAIKGEEREAAREAALDELAAKRATKPARTRSTSQSFSSMSKVAFDVTSDEAVGYSPPPPPMPEPAKAPVAKAEGLTLHSKVCPVCGERVPGAASECPACGAWFSKDSFRFGKG